MDGDKEVKRPPLGSRGQCSKVLAVLKAAGEVFCRDGFAGASIDLIASEAGVSRQTIYNHYGDKERLFLAVLRDMIERSAADLFTLIATFPERPRDLEAELTDFAARYIRSCVCNRRTASLRKMIQREAERFPELFATWRENGPGKAAGTLAACLARLAHSGYLHIDDPDLAARQFIALVGADFQGSCLVDESRPEEEIRASAAAAVRTFLRAFIPAEGAG